MNNFDKIIGYKEIKLELERICDILNNAEKYAKLGVTIPAGLLLHGEPGVGKTTMAQCFVKSVNRKVFVCRKKDIDCALSHHITWLFEEAAKTAPSIVFLDDLDKFANEDKYHRNAEEFVTVQSCIDEVKGKNVFVLATANDLDNLPDSLLRAGRFDKSIEVKNPTGKDAEEIIKYYLSQKSYVGDLDVTSIARILDGKSCAELETVINEAGVYAGYEGKSQIEMDDVVRACMRVIFQAPQSLNDCDPDFAERVAYHEAGHAVVAELLEPGSVSIVSTCPHGAEIGGITGYYQTDKYWYSKRRMENRVMALLAGKAAIEIKYGEVDVGANSDLHRAFDIATRFIDNYCSYGFEGWQEEREASNDLFSRRETQIYTEMSRYYQQARKLLVDNREFLDKLAHALIERKTLINKDIQQIRSSCKLAA